MSVKWITWAWEQDLPSGRKFVLVALADHASDDGACWPSSGRLSEKTGLGRSAVLGHLKALEDSGLIVRPTRRRHKDGSLSTYEYQLVGEVIVKPGDPEAYVQNPDVGEDALGPETESLGSDNKVPRSRIWTAEPSLTVSNRQENARFDEFWEQYPRKVAKQDALKAWKKLKADETADALEALPGHLRKWAKMESKFIPHPASWLNGRRWEDNVEQLPMKPQTREVDNGNGYSYRLAKGVWS